jgi:hypothetical protein
MPIHIPTYVDYQAIEKSALLLKGLFKSNSVYKITDMLHTYVWHKKNSVKVNVRLETWGRCYDHIFLRFSKIFNERICVFSKASVMIKILHNLALFRVKNANFFAEFFGENI